MIDRTDGSADDAANLAVAADIRLAAALPERARVALRGDGFVVAFHAGRSRLLTRLPDHLRNRARGGDTLRLVSRSHDGGRVYALTWPQRWP